MFRDPELLPRVPARRSCPLLRTYPFVRIWHAGCSTGEEVYSMAILLQEEGLYDRCRIYATDINEVVLQQARSGHLPARPRCRSTRANYLNAGGNGVVLRVLHGAVRPRALQAVAAREHRLLAAQPGHRRLVQRVQRHPLPQRDDLLRPALQDRVHELFYDSLRQVRRARRSGARSRCASRRTSADYEELDAGREALPEGRARWPAAGGRSARRWAGSTRWRPLLARPAADFAAAAGHRAAPRHDERRRAWSAALRSAAALPRRSRPRTRSRSSAGRVYLAPADYHLLVEPGQLRAVHRRAGAATRGPRSTCCSSRPPTSTVDAVIGVMLTGANADGGAGSREIRRRGGCALVQEPATAECA